MIGKMKIIILVALISLCLTLRVQKKSSDDADKSHVEEASRTAAGTEWVYLYNYSYTPYMSYTPVYYSSGVRTYYYYPYYNSYSYYPRNYFWYYRKSGEETAPAVDAARTEKKKDEVDNNENKKEEKIQVKVEELQANLKKLKKELWKDENYNTAELRKENKAYDPSWLISQLNISTVLQIEDLLKEKQAEPAKVATK